MSTRSLSPRKWRCNLSKQDVLSPTSKADSTFVPIIRSIGHPVHHVTQRVLTCLTAGVCRSWIVRKIAEQTDKYWSQLFRDSWIVGPAVQDGLSRCHNTKKCPNTTWRCTRYRSFWSHQERDGVSRQVPLRRVAGDATGERMRRGWIPCILDQFDHNRLLWNFPGHHPAWNDTWGIWLEQYHRDAYSQQLSRVGAPLSTILSISDGTVCNTEFTEIIAIMEPTVESEHWYWLMPQREQLFDVESAGPAHWDYQFDAAHTESGCWKKMWAAEGSCQRRGLHISAHNVPHIIHMFVFFGMANLMGALKVTCSVMESVS